MVKPSKWVALIEDASSQYPFTVVYVEYPIDNDMQIDLIHVVGVNNI